MYTNEQIKEYKERFFSDLFQLVAVKRGNTIGSKLKCTNNYFESYLDNQWSKKYYKIERNDYIAQVAMVCYEALIKFNADNRIKNFKYEKLLAGEKSELNQVFAYFKSLLSSNLLQYYAYINGQFIDEKKKQLNGKSKYFNVYHTLSATSLDVPNKDSAHDETLINNLSNDNRISIDTTDYHALSFLKWYRENRDDLLIESQHNALSVMIRHQDEYSVDCTQYGYKDAQQIRNIKSKIKTKVNNRWAKVKDELDIPFVKQHQRRELAYWRELIEMCERDDLGNEELRKMITNHITNRVKYDTQFSDLMYDNFDSRIIVKAMLNEPFNNEFIYQLCMFAEMKVIELNQVDYSNVISFSAISERKRIAQEELEKLKDKEKEFDELKSYYVYTLSPSGVLMLREEYEDDEELQMVEEN